MPSPQTHRSHLLLIAALSLVACQDSPGRITEPLARPAFATAPGTADMQISGSSDKGTPTGGATFTYTFQVKWASGSLASNVVFTDTLPADVGLNYAAVNGVPFPCSTNAMVVTCTLGNFEKSSSPMNVTVNVNAPPTVGSFSNTGIITSDTPDPQPANNRVTVNEQVKTPLAACPVPAGQPTILGFVGGGFRDQFGILEQFAFTANDGTLYWVETNFWDTTQPLTSVINLDCKTSPGQFIGNFMNITGVVDGTSIDMFGITYQVLHASVVQAFTHKDAGA